MPRGSTIESDTVFGVTCQLPLLREEFGIATLTFHLDLRRRAASRRALPCPSSVMSISAFYIRLLSPGQEGKLGKVTSSIFHIVRKYLERNKTYADMSG